MSHAPAIAAVEAERAFIGALLSSADALPFLEQLDDDDLTQPVLQKVVGAVRRLVAVGAPVDQITVLCELRRTGEAVTAAGQTSAGLLLAEYAESAPVPQATAWYLRGVIEAALRRRVLEYGTRLMQRASTVALEDLLSELQADLMAIVAITARLKALPAAV
jgi:replicative DNA helicase